MTMRYLLCRLVLGLIAILPVSTYAAVEMEMVATGSDVILSGSGTLNLSSTTNFATSGTKTQSAIDAGGLFAPSAITGSNTEVEVRVECGGVTGPVSLGSGTAVNKSDEGRGHTFGIFGAGENYGSGGAGLCLLVEKAYVSGDQLSGSARFANTSLSSLGVTKGTYRWTWGTGASADSLTLYIRGKPSPPTPVPTTPGALMLLLMILLALMGVKRARL